MVAELLTVRASRHFHLKFTKRFREQQHTAAAASYAAKALGFNF